MIAVCFTIIICDPVHADYRSLSSAVRHCLNHLLVTNFDWWAIERMEDELKMESQSLDPDQGSCSVTDELSQQPLCPSPKLSVFELSKELETKNELVSFRLLFV